ncbi:MAG: hypothetical protein M3R20_02060, partial [Pseudomonadota bacterium]|nr:hypothetical protein [Pseudomonadota bacterium]
ALTPAPLPQAGEGVQKQKPAFARRLFCARLEKAVVPNRAEDSAKKVVIPGLTRTKSVTEPGLRLFVL